MQGWWIANTHGAIATVRAASAVLVLSGAPATAQSANSKRLCKPRIEWSGLGGTRAEAQRKAIDGWASAAAGQHGDAFTKWTIAGVARTSCSLTPEGHRCRAAASPCRDLNDSVKPATGQATVPTR